tara:strand:+ start:357 stop:572 length:216 start_codon:yes stop_codon:yes gene_type:complete
MQTNPELRMSLWKKHVKVCVLWGIETPLTWHDWKFQVWRYYDFSIDKQLADIGILIKAASMAMRNGRKDNV